MSYIEINFNQVEGYDKLSEQAKKIFKDTYKIHNKIHGIDYKKKWIPTKVEEHTTHLKVYFKNGSWLHYLPNNTWY